MGLPNARCLSVAQLGTGLPLFLRSFLGASRALPRLVKRGGEAAITLHVRNFLPRSQVHRIEIHTPPGLSAEPARIEESLPAILAASSSSD